MAELGIWPNRKMCELLVTFHRTFSYSAIIRFGHIPSGIWPNGIWPNTILLSHIIHSAIILTEYERIGLWPNWIMCENFKFSVIDCWVVTYSLSLYYL